MESFLPYERDYSRLDEEELKLLLRRAKDNKWDVLDLSNCGLSSLPDELWELTSLKLLYLGNRKRRAELNTFTSISAKIENLKNLEAISICGLGNIDIPETFKNLPNIRYVDYFDDSNAHEVHVNLLNKNIKAIGVNCKSVSDVRKICRIKNIEEIYLTDSEIDALPEEIGSLKALKRLVISNTKISNIPESIQNLGKIKSFSIWHTPLAKKIPVEIAQQSAIELIRYICNQQNEHGEYFFNESKMLIVGQGNVGKSCLLERITEDKYVEKESTEGIDVKIWKYEEKDKNFTLNIWDFGGQEIYHSTHQLFLTKRSLYVLVWDARSEEEYGRIDYWLKTIETFADNSPIIMVINKCDKDVTRINRIDFAEYKSRYPSLKAQIDISCKDNVNIKRLKRLITKYASNLPITKERWLKSWSLIRTKIIDESKSKDYIAFEEYLSICKSVGVGKEEALSLGKYLHDLGIILHYQDDISLRNIVILNPEWATDALYKILDSQETILKGRNGILYISDLPKIWTDGDVYPEHKYIFLLKILERFDLCYSIDENTYLVAELLENAAIKRPDDWNLDENNICLEYDYDFMPAGLMTRFIVKIHDYIARIAGINMCWKKGVYLQNRSAYASVIMNDYLSEKKIVVKVSKNNNSVAERDLLFAIRNVMRTLNNSFCNLNVEESVPCNCSKGCKQRYKFDTLTRALENRQSTIQCHESYKDVKVLSLLEGIEDMKNDEISPYSINIEANPTIINKVVSENSVTQTNKVDIREIRRNINELQGDITELIDSINNDQKYDSLKSEIQQIRKDIEKLGDCNNIDDMAKSGKLNKLKRFLINMSDENSDERRIINTIKNGGIIIGEMVLKCNDILSKIDLPQIPF